MKLKSNAKDKKNNNENNNEKLKFLLFFVIVFSVLILDRCTKFLSNFIYGCFFFCMKRSINYGAAFNLLQGFDWARALLIIVALAVLFITACFYFKVRGKGSFHFGLAFLFAGTLCNMLDRIFYSYVIDWLSFSFLPVPAFNIADISNIAGVILLIIVLLKKKS